MKPRHSIIGHVKICWRWFSEFSNNTAWGEKWDLDGGLFLRQKDKSGINPANCVRAVTRFGRLFALMLLIPVWNKNNLRSKGNSRGGISQNVYTIGFFRTQNFTQKVRDSQQIQCYPKCAIRDKFNTKKVNRECKAQGNSVKHKGAV